MATLKWVGSTTLDRRQQPIFSDLIEPQVAAAYRLALAILGDEEEARDAAQDAMLAAWRHWSSLRDVANVQAWFSRIVVNICRDRLRRRRPRPATGVDLLPTIDDGMAGQHAERDLVYRLLDELTPDHRLILVLRYFDDCSLPQLAQRLGVPLGTVKSRLHNATAQLRRRLEASERGSHAH